MQCQVISSLEGWGGLILSQLCTICVVGRIHTSSLLMEDKRGFTGGSGGILTLIRMLKVPCSDFENQLHPPTACLTSSLLASFIIRRILSHSSHPHLRCPQWSKFWFSIFELGNIFVSWQRTVTLQAQERPFITLLWVHLKILNVSFSKIIVLITLLNGILRQGSEVTDTVYRDTDLTSKMNLTDKNKKQSLSVTVIDVKKM